MRAFVLDCRRPGAHGLGNCVGKGGTAGEGEGEGEVSIQRATAPFIRHRSPNDATRPRLASPSAWQGCLPVFKQLRLVGRKEGPCGRAVAPRLPPATR